MKPAQSRLTSQGQISVPAEVRRHLGLAAGSIVEWRADGDAVVVRRSHRYSVRDVNAKLFPEGVPKARNLKTLKEGLQRDIAKRHARR